MRVVKRYRRLWIVDEQERLIYTPPDFIRLKSREPMHELAQALETQQYIDAVMEFEAAA